MNAVFVLTKFNATLDPSRSEMPVFCYESLALGLDDIF